MDASTRAVTANKCRGTKMTVEPRHLNHAVRVRVRLGREYHGAHRGEVQSGCDVQPGSDEQLERLFVAPGASESKPGTSSAGIR
jgi:hypothetical protein